MTHTKNIPIGEVLREYGYITDSQLKKALSEQKNDPQKRRLGTILIDLGYVSEEQMLTALGQRLALPLIDLKNCTISSEAVAKIPKQLAQKHNIIALSEAGGRLNIAVSDPLNFYAIEDIRQVVNMPCVISLAGKASIAEAIDYHYSEIEARAAAESATSEQLSTNDFEGDLLYDEDDAAPIVRLVGNLLIRGYTTNASDIHIEPFEEKTIVRMRVDGALVEYMTLSPAVHPSVIARIKILGNLDIAERRAPQDGHFRIKLEGFEMNIRVSIVPTTYGEKAVLRFLTTNVRIDHAGQFGMDEANYKKLEKMLQTPHGIIYLTGPTGSGKTTTLYMVLEHLSDRACNISTIEDPVERNIMKITQMQVNPLAGLTFESGLRSLLRQDPDIIMVGETRDSETASISVRAAITGHLVLSTLHTNDAVSSIVRLEDMGIAPYLLASSLVGIVAQRLVRKVCPYCAYDYSPTEDEKATAGIALETARKGKGCHRCNETGYLGRVAVHEILEVDKTIRAMISDGTAVAEIMKYATGTQKMKTLRDSVRELVLKGETTLDEMIKLTYYLD